MRERCGGGEWAWFRVLQGGWEVVVCFNKNGERCLCGAKKEQGEWSLEWGEKRQLGSKRSKRVLLLWKLRNRGMKKTNAGFCISEL